MCTAPQEKPQATEPQEIHHLRQALARQIPRGILSLLLATVAVAIPRGILSLLLVTVIDARWRARVSPAGWRWRAPTNPVRANQASEARLRACPPATCHLPIGAGQRRRFSDRSHARGPGRAQVLPVLSTQIPERMLPPVVGIPGQILLDVRPCLQLGNT